MSIVVDETPLTDVQITENQEVEAVETQQD